MHMPKGEKRGASGAYSAFLEKPVFMVGVHAWLKMKGRNICPPILHRLGTAASDRYNPYIHASVIKRRNKGRPCLFVAVS